MMSGRVVLRWRIGFAVIIGLFVLPDAQAAFGSFMPLSYSGQVSYAYGFTDSAGAQSESTSLLVGLNASGYIWRPWFATTSFALNAGLSRFDTSTSSSDGTVGSGSFSVGIFPHSRFPFSMSYSRSDSRSQQFQDITQGAGNTHFQITRLTLRQSYRPRAYNQLFNARYSTTDFEGDVLSTNSTQYGVDYQMRMSHQSLSIGISHSGSGSGSGESTTDSWSLSHVYTASVELGVNSLASSVQSDPVGATGTITDSQLFSAFYWRPEHRPVSISGGVRLSESKSDGASSTLTRSMNTNLGMGYRLSRALNLNATVALGTSDSGTAQSLTTSQSVSMSYSGGTHEIAGFRYGWQWSAGGSNSTSEVDTGGVTTSSDSQSLSASLGHNFGKTWSIGSSTSMAGTFSQAVSGSKNSQSDQLSSGLNQGASLSWSSRGKSGSSYISTRLNDSRNFGGTDTVFDDFSLNYNADTAFSRLSTLSGNANFQVSRNESEVATGGKVVTTSKNLVGGLTYNHSRPFGIYNLQFTSNLQGSRQIDSPTPSTTLHWEGVFRYRLGLLSTSLTFRAFENPGGSLTKSMYFQATRSF